MLGSTTGAITTKTRRFFQGAWYPQAWFNWIHGTPNKLCVHCYRPKSMYKDCRCSRPAPDVSPWPKAAPSAKQGRALAAARRAKVRKARKSFAKRAGRHGPLRTISRSYGARKGKVVFGCLRCGALADTLARLATSQCGSPTREAPFRTARRATHLRNLAHLAEHASDDGVAAEIRQYRRRLVSFFGAVGVHSRGK